MSNNNETQPSRRRFLTGVAGAGIVGSMPTFRSALAGPEKATPRVQVTYFSKHM
jgi:hypothetical protein